MEERKRNELGENYLYLSTGCSGYRTLKAFYENEEDEDREFPISIDGMQGLVLRSEENVPEGGVFDSCIRGLYDVTNNNVIAVKIRDPAYPEGFIFPARKLPNATEPPRVLKQKGDERNQHYRPNIGFNNNRQQYASVGDSGHRAVNHYTNNRYADNGNGKFYLFFSIQILLR